MNRNLLNNAMSFTGMKVCEFIETFTSYTVFWSEASTSRILCASLTQRVILSITSGDEVSGGGVSVVESSESVVARLEDLTITGAGETQCWVVIKSSQVLLPE